MNKTLLFSCAALFAELSIAGSFEANGCFAKWDDNALSVGNSIFTRTYSMVGGRLQTVALRTSDGFSWIRGKDTVATEKFPAPLCEVARRNPAGIEGLSVSVGVGDGTTVIRLYPNVAGVLKEENWKRALPEIKIDDGVGAFLRIAQHGWRLDSESRKVGDALEFAPAYLRVTGFTLFDQTDIRNDLLKKNDWLMPSCQVTEAASVTALDVRDLATGNGIVFLRLAPMPIVRPTDIPDFVLSPSTRSIVTLANGYPLAELAYSGGEAGRIRALQDLQRAIRPYREGRDGVFLSNTWGDGNQDSRINAEFLMKEVDAAADIGVDVIQVDDGWQRGRTANSKKKLLPGIPKAWSNFRVVDPKFWEPDEERFPNGLEPLASAAKSKGLVFGIWFGPDSSDDLKYWEEDADCLIGYYRRLGIRYFKIDSLNITTPLGFERNRKFFDKMLVGSNSDMVFDLDCTAGVRPGYFGLMDIGPLFVENRYARVKDVRRYMPHLALRNLWTLSQVVDPVRLRIELMNPGKNQANYGNDPLAPSRWPADALFAIAMVASPLGWMELSDVSEDVRAAWRPLVSRWKRERGAMHGGTIFPIGSEPDGFSWTGFFSCAKDASCGYAIVFKEASIENEFEIDLSPYLPRGASFSKAEVIGGRGKAELDGDGRDLEVKIPGKLDFAWIKLTR